MQKASMVVESQNKCLADELNEYIEQILEREASIVVERTAALHAEELARVRLESEASASHAGEKKLQEMSTLHSAELTKLREELHFMSSERVQAEALNVVEREALERERGGAGVEIARAREANANIDQTIKHSLVIIKHKLLIQVVASSEERRIGTRSGAMPPRPSWLPLALRWRRQRAATRALRPRTTPLARD